MATLTRDLAVCRLLRDFKHVLEHPEINVVARPLEDNLFVWHGNVTTSEGSLAAVPVHFAILFSHDYPSTAPEVRPWHYVLQVSACALLQMLPNVRVLERNVEYLSLIHISEPTRPY